MNAITEFKFHTHAVRTLDISGDIRFVATDVAKALEYESAKDMIRIVDDEDKGWAVVPTLGGEQQMHVINESGLYAATFRSRKPSARAFRRWVTSEVLPSIRRTGGYQRAAAELPDTLTPEQYDTEKARLAALQARLAAVRISMSCEQYERLQDAHLQVGKKVWLVSELVGRLESLGIPREAAEELTGHNRNAVRQCAHIARERHGDKPQRGPRQFSEEEITFILGMSEAGDSATDTAQALGRNESSVRSFLKSRAQH